MKIRLTLLAVLLAVAGACSSKTAQPTPTPTTTPTYQTTTTTENNTQEINACISRVSSVSSDFTTLASKTENVDVTSEYEVRNIIRLARSALANGRQVVAECGRFAPTEASALDRNFDALESGIDEMESLADSLWG